MQLQTKSLLNLKLQLRIKYLWTILLLGLVTVSILLVPTAAAQGNESAVQSGIIVFQTVSGGPIYAVDPAGSNLRYLTTGIDPALSPDGQWVAFTRWDDVQNGAFGSLWIINVDGSSERPILGEIRQPKSPTWSADGSQITVSMQHGGWLEPKQVCGHARPPREAYDIKIIVEGPGKIKYCYRLPPNPYWGLRVVEVASGAFEDLPHDSHSFSPTWDPANDWHLVYDGDLGLVNLDLNLGNTWPLTDDVRDHSPRFSPDGSKIAVTYKQHTHWEIHLINADGSGRVRLTETPLWVTMEQRLNGQEVHSWNNVAPAWSPDGSQIAFLSDRSGQWEIWLMNADGSNPHPLFAHGMPDGLALQYNNVDERVISWQ